MKITAVAAGMLQAKKEKQHYSSLYLNYGLLGLVTNLQKKGFEVKMFQGDYKSIPEIITEITEERLKDSIVLLSIPSFLSINWALSFAKEIKKYNTHIIIGGRWVLDTNFEWIKDKFKGIADGFSLGCPDDEVELFAYPDKWHLLEEKKDIQAYFICLIILYLTILQFINRA